MNDDGSLVRLEGIHKWFGDDLHVLRGIELAIRPGEVLVVIGPSGSGKSTLLRTINMLEEPTEGKVWFEHKELTDVRTNLDEARTHMGMVFQSFNLFPHMTALRRAAAAGGHRPGPGHAAPRDAVRRGHLGPRSRAHPGGPRRHEAPRRGG